MVVPAADRGPSKTAFGQCPRVSIDVDGFPDSRRDYAVPSVPSISAKHIAAISAGDLQRGRVDAVRRGCCWTTGWPAGLAATIRDQPLWCPIAATDAPRLRSSHRGHPGRPGRRLHVVRPERRARSSTPRPHGSRLRDQARGRHRIDRLPRHLHGPRGIARERRGPGMVEQDLRPPGGIRPAAPAASRAPCREGRGRQRVLAGRCRTFSPACCGRVECLRRLWE
jgi:hypothetical protein